MTNMEIKVETSKLVADLMSQEGVSFEMFDSLKQAIVTEARKQLKAQGYRVVETGAGYGVTVDEKPAKKARKAKKAAPAVSNQDDDFGIEFTNAPDADGITPQQYAEANESQLQMESEQALDAELAVAMSTGPTVKKVYAKADDMVSQAFSSLRKVRLGDKRVTFAKNCSVKDVAGFPAWLEKNADKYAAAVLTRVGKDYSNKVFVLAATDSISELVGQLHQALPGFDVEVSL